MNWTYDKLAAGERLRLKRTLLGFTQDETAEKIGRASKYYADIERGSCGMSIETLLALSATFNMSLDYIIYGKTASEMETFQQTEEVCAILGAINSLPQKKQAYALSLLKLFLSACTMPEPSFQNKQKNPDKQ